MSEQQQHTELGTTTVGVAGKDFVILAADKRASMGHLTIDKSTDKIFALDDHVGITTAGSVGDAQKLVRIMRAELTLNELETEKLSVKATVTLLANLMHGNRMFPFLNQFVIGGVDDGAGIVYSIDPTGGYTDHHTFTATGSGSPLAYGLLEDAYTEDIGKSDATKLAIRTITAASSRDVNSGDGVDVAIVDKKGFRRLSDSEIEKHL